MSSPHTTNRNVWVSDEIPYENAAVVEEVIRYIMPDDDRRGVDVIYTPGPPVHALFDFHSTIVMNWFDGDTLYTLWPKSTFSGKFHRPREQMWEPSVVAINKYVARGYVENFTNIPEPTMPASHTNVCILPVHSRTIRERNEPIGIASLDQHLVQ